MTHRYPHPTAWLLTLCISIASPLASADPAAHANEIPHVGKRAKQDYLHYSISNDNRAFAIAPGGSWAWVTEQPSPSAAGELALEYCRQYSEQRCVLYAVNDEVVFDSEQWSTLWRPYKSKADADKAGIGTLLGQRFPNLAFIDKQGVQHTLGQSRGRVVILHFWGSWCPPCCAELPRLVKLRDQLKTDGVPVDLIFVPVRESAKTSHAWLKEEGIAIDVVDAGAHENEGGEYLNLGNGEKLHDRSIAKVFPSTYVLDRNGIVVFAKNGPAPDWNEYIPFINDVVANTGK